MALKTSIYLNDDNEEFLHKFKRGEELQASSSVSYILAGWRAFIKEGVVLAGDKLLESDWPLVLQVFNGHVFEERDHQRNWRISSLVADDLGVDDFFDIKDLAVKETLQRISSLSPLEEMAVAEAARLFWYNKPCDNDKKDETGACEWLLKFIEDL